MVLPEKKLPISGELFEIEGCPAFLIRATAKPEGRNPWVWYAPTLPAYPGQSEKWMFDRFLEAGISIAGIDVGESYGSPDGRSRYSVLYAHLTNQLGMDRRAALLARSRGGLMLYIWAVENADKVACVAGIYPVCSLKSYPGIEKASRAYGVAARELANKLSLHNPIDRLRALVKARVPIYHIHGDSDEVVPVKVNSGELADRYRALDGEVVLDVAKGHGHSSWSGFFECQPLVDFVIERCSSSTRG